MNKNQPNSLMVAELLFLVTLISFLCAMLILYVSAFSKAFLYLIILGIGSMAPALAAVIIVTINYRKSGLKQFLKSKYMAHFNIKFCIVAFLIPLLILFLAKLLSNISLSSDILFNFPNAKKLMIIFFALIAEELGWRGFLQERIEQKAGMIFTPLFVGVIWGLWHFHFFFDRNYGCSVLCFTARMHL